MMSRNCVKRKMNSFTIRCVALCVVLFALTSCHTPQPPGVVAEFSFRHMPKIEFNLSNIVVIDEFRPSYKDPHVEHLFVPSPTMVIRRWREDRLRALGNTGILRVIIKDASIVEEKLPVFRSLESLVQVNQSERYKARVHVLFEAESLQRGKIQRVDVTAERTLTVPENISLLERQNAWYRLIESVMDDFNITAENAIDLHLAEMLFHKV